MKLYQQQESQVGNCQLKWWKRQVKTRWTIQCGGFNIVHPWNKENTNVCSSSQLHMFIARVICLQARLASYESWRFD
uniref:Uncharacterized protein n=1 Tax=Kalanchoe fedtschenkoi TaxID=63787 RepID=A0A7N0TCE5_KALFE